MLPTLTHREREVLQLIASGLSNREISRALRISESTVEHHNHHIYAKLGISNRAQAVAYAFRSKLMPLDESVIEIEGILHDSPTGDH